MDGGYGLIMALCVGAGGACWLAVYADAIRLGIRQKNGCIPLFALGLHIAWEGIYACAEYFIRGDAGAQAMANGIWLALEALIMITWYRLGRKEAPGDTGRKWFAAWSALALACCLAMQVMYMAGLGEMPRAGLDARLNALIPRDVGAQAVGGAAWGMLLLFVVITWVRLVWLQPREDAGGTRPWSALALTCCLAAQLLLVAWLGGAQGEKYAAYLQSIAVSVAYLYMLTRRRTRGQTALIAACKGAVSVAFAVCGAVRNNGRMMAAGMLCIALDGACMVCLRPSGRREKSGPAWKSA
ncbi:MAG: hypothetical protein ACI4O7_03985 [Aristaeellaceae bacterium]